MLTADLVRWRSTKEDELVLRQIAPKRRNAAKGLAAELIAAAARHVGESREDLKAAWACITVASPDRKVFEGLKKLVRDRCEFASEETLDPPALRAEVFGAASAARAGEGAFDRDAVIAAVAEAHGVEPAVIESSLFADLKQAQTLTAFEPIEAEALLDAYALAQEQAVLLRATRIQVRISEGDVGAYRHFFRALKFRQLLHRIEPLPGGDGYLIEIDGPHSLFRSSTRYGQRLALLVPAIRACPKWAVRAQLLWGKDKRRLWFAMQGESGGATQPSRLPDDVAELVERIRAVASPWRVRRSTRILHLPGVGVCVPDLVFTHESGANVYLEVMGFWSRAAVWKRVELVQQGLSDQIVFAVSSRLRVSEAVLGDGLPGQLYVYKQKMNARRILERLDALL